MTHPPAGKLPIVLAITGASGAAYATTLLRAMLDAEQPVQLVVSAHGFRIMELELGISSLAGLRAATTATAPTAPTAPTAATEPTAATAATAAAPWDRLVTVFDSSDRGAAPASGSARSLGMIVCPCSMGTLSAISVGASRSLVERAADVMLKERRKLLLVTRETPLSTIHLENMLRLSQSGCVILPAAPGFYNKPQKIQDLVDFVVARALDHFEIPHNLSHRWSGGAVNADE